MPIAVIVRFKEFSCLFRDSQCLSFNHRPFFKILEIKLENNLK